MAWKGCEADILDGEALAAFDCVRVPWCRRCWPVYVVGLWAGTIASRTKTKRGEDEPDDGTQWLGAEDTALEEGEFEGV